jgi:choline dehydrogenase-like flavoprotein
MVSVDSLPFTDDLLPALGHSRPPASPDITLRFSKWIPFKKRNLADTLGAQALAHPLVTVFTHANGIQLEASPTHPNRIASARVLNYNAREFHFSAAHLIVCVGTVESSRLLLCSPCVPNPHDQIGRYFHDHVACHAARFLPPARERAIDLFAPFYVDGTMHTAKLEASPALRSQQHLQAVMAHVVVMESEGSGVAAIRNLLRSLQQRKLKHAVVANLIPVLRGAGDVARLWFYSRFKKRRAIGKRAELILNIDVEQAPHPENRIELSATDTDVLGLPRTVVDWQVRATELDTVARFVPVIRSYLSAAGMDTLEWEQGTPAMVDTYHMMGGLRMGTDPAASVVDANLKVHGLSNLYIASCAVFPSGSSSNPTFTLMALALRLADQLAEQCRQAQDGSATRQSLHL